MSHAPDVMTLPELAAFLRLPDEIVATLVVQRDLPSVLIAGEQRFLRHRVLGWLELHEQRGDLLPAEVPQDEPVEPTVHLAPAAGSERPFVEASAMDALAGGASDPARNLDRLKLRDSLLELNEELMPILGRLSGGRLHPHGDERYRTSPWRIEEAPGHVRRVDAISIAWGAGDAPPPGFVDRPRVEVELAPGELRISLVTEQGFESPLGASELERLRDVGIAVDHDSDPPSLAKVYPIGAPAPTLETVAKALEADLRALVPIWAQSR